MRLLGGFLKPVSLITGFKKPRLGYHSKEFLRGASSGVIAVFFLFNSVNQITKFVIIL